MQPPKFARHIPLARRNTLILLFVELRMIRLTLLVVAAVCVVYAGNSSVRTECDTVRGRTTDGKEPAKATATPGREDEPGSGFAWAPAANGTHYLTQRIPY
jgi:hypothetical protein